ncbi:hypothetical protein J6590_015431 [Homalodisca vitripennis]|nr:hypothetical protein J6590_015431 [Homalodisca vitripennis]
MPEYPMLVDMHCPSRSGAAPAVTTPRYRLPALRRRFIDKPLDLVSGRDRTCVCVAHILWSTESCARSSRCCRGCSSRRIIDHIGVMQGLGVGIAFIKEGACLRAWHLYMEMVFVLTEKNKKNAWPSGNAENVN